MPLEWFLLLIFLTVVCGLLAAIYSVLRQTFLYWTTEQPPTYTHAPKIHEDTPPHDGRVPANWRNE